MLNSAQIHQVHGQPLYDVHRDEVGPITQVYLHAVTGEPEWVAVRTGPDAPHESLVPLAQATMTGAGLSVPYSSETVTTAPHLQAEAGVVSPTHAAQLYRHYGVPDTQDSSQPGWTNAERHNDPSLPSGEEGMTRSEEQLEVTTRTYATETVRLRKHIITEEKTITVSVRREVISLDREPITDSDSDMGGLGPDSSQPEYEMVLSEEQLVVQKEVVPVERVTLVIDLITEQQDITEQVRREQIETNIADGDGEDLTKR